MLPTRPENGGIVCPHCLHVMTATETQPHGKREVVPEDSTDWPQWTLASIRNPGDALNKGADAIKQVWCAACGGLLHTAFVAWQPKRTH
jgi:hypothetical protein